MTLSRLSTADATYDAAAAGAATQAATNAAVTPLGCDYTWCCPSSFIDVGSHAGLQTLTADFQQTSNLKRQ
jgi:hypothetical protein